MMSIIFLSARGPVYLVMLLAVAIVFGLERIIKIVAYLVDRHEDTKRKTR